MTVRVPTIEQMDDQIEHPQTSAQMSTGRAAHAVVGRGSGNSRVLWETDLHVTQRSATPEVSLDSRGRDQRVAKRESARSVVF